MRLSPDQTRRILQSLRQQFGPHTQVSLYGSRLDDAGRGGDVDLLVETEQPATLRQRAMAQWRLESELQLPVDMLVVQQADPGSAFVRIARATAQRLGSP